MGSPYGLDQAMKRSVSATAPFKRFGGVMWREAWADPYSRTVMKMSMFTVVQAVVMIFYAVNA